MNQSIHQFTVKDIKGNEVSLEKYKGKVLLIVNTATKCGFTPQLGPMEELYKEFKEEGFEILAFPSNDFANQEPREGEEIEQFCMINYNASYPIFDKIHVKGKGVAPLYKFLSTKRANGKVGIKPMWNFHKYLIDKNGKVVRSYFTITNPSAKKVKRAIRRLLDS